MPPPRIWHTTTFRLATLFAGTFAAGIILLLGLVYIQTSSFMSQRANAILSMEFEPVSHGRRDAVRQLLDETTARDPLTEFGLFSAQGARLAGLGTMTPSDMPLDGVPRDFPSRGGQPPQRALGERLPWGDVLIIQRDIRQLMELRAVMLGALVWSGAAIALLGLILGVSLSLNPLRRVRAMQQASNAIAEGNLDIRLPVEGGRDELDQLARIVNAMMDEVERLMGEARAVGESVAHGLRTPLTRLRTTLDHAYDVDREDMRGVLIERCIVETDSVLARFRGLLRIAAVESRSRRQGIGSISLSAVVDQVGELYLPVATSRDVNLCIRTEPDVQVRADAELMFEALSNLVDNALKFTPPGGEVRLTLSREARAAVAEVRDNGPGVPEAERALVVKRFYRSHNAADIPGHGLGLALVAAVAALHDFELSIDDAHPGAVFRLICPQAS